MSVDNNFNIKQKKNAIYTVNLNKIDLSNLDENNIKKSMNLIEWIEKLSKIEKLKLAKF